MKQFSIYIYIDIFSLVISINSLVFSIMTIYSNLCQHIRSDMEVCFDTEFYALIPLDLILIARIISL